jgi:hypothetical protein
MRHVVPAADGCWLWTGTCTTHGFFGWNGKMANAHRIAWMLFKGEIPEGLWVCHTCDVGICVNPDHLWLGTPKDNSQDMKRKNRHCPGSRNGAARLNEEKVKQIKILLKEGITQRAIAKRYGVHQATIWRISKGRKWNHIQ